MESGLRRSLGSGSEPEEVASRTHGQRFEKEKVGLSDEMAGVCNEGSWEIEYKGKKIEGFW